MTNASVRCADGVLGSLRTVLAARRSGRRWRSRSRSPVSYPVACSPQAWASATLPGLLAAAIGLRFVPERNEIRFDRPVLPPFLEEVELHGLKVGNCEADVLLRRHAIDVGVTVLRRSGPVNVVTVS